MCRAIRILIKLERANLILEYRECYLASEFGCAASVKEEARLKLKQVDIEKYGEQIRVHVNGIFPISVIAQLKQVIAATVTRINAD
ncbi:MAG: hypothetical protein EZS28_010287 [Streblomastix strix]|uniref:Uncharacterized protein n=1 Tax=Streblomastix strix TaxID=222440 RepID=A0A5J4WGT4_9EUKA|nr:MAG: hypothetical protein EZS28_010287 [Streblomastix strix]